MAISLRQSTAGQEVPLGHFLDSADGDTEETALTIANTDILLWKAGATTLASKNSGGATHISNGIYYCTLDETDTDTLGPLVLFVHVAGALAVRVECEVLTANVYDALIAGSDFLQGDTVQIEGNDATDTIGSAVWSLTKFLGFDGYNDYVNLGSGYWQSLVTGTGFTVEAWIKPGAGLDSYAVIFARAANWVFALREFGSGPVAYGHIKFSTQNANVTTSTIVPFGQWSHVAMTWLSSYNRPRIWINGVEAAISTGQDKSGTHSNQSTNLYVGMENDAGSSFIGWIGWARVSIGARYTANFIPPQRNVPPPSDANVRALVIYEGTGSTTGWGPNGAGTIVGAYWSQDSQAGEQVWNYGNRTLTESSGLTVQNVRDAMKLAPSAGDPAAGSIDAHLDTIEGDTSTDIPALIGDLDIPTAADIADAVLDEAAADHLIAGSVGRALADILADTGVDGVVIGQAMRQAIADEILRRGVANVEDTADATSLAALVLAAFESAISGSTWTIYKTNHATVFATRQVTSSPTADPIVEVT